jgi:ABC-2 type transport system permease protein
LLIIFITLLLTTILFSTAGLINGIFANSFDDVSIVPTFILTPLTYLGGVFYSLSLLPEFWQWVSKINPIVYMVSGFRFGFLGVSDINFYVSLGILIGFNLVLLGWAYSLINRGVGIRS